MERREIKKLLIDLNLSVAAIARAVGLSRPAVYKYFDSQLKAPAKREAIEHVLRARARQVNRGSKVKVEVPELWSDRR